MKKHFLKSFALLAMLFSAITMSAASGVDWSSLTWVGASSDKYKVSTADGLRVINVQHPGFASESGIYVEAPSAISACSVNGAIQGAGVVMYLSSFELKETKVTITHAQGTITFWVYYEDGIDWSSLTWVGASSDKYKVSTADGLRVINVQHPGFASESGIYIEVPSAISACSVNGAVQGAGVVMYLSSFIYQETKVTITHAQGVITFWVYYADGIEGQDLGSNEEDESGWGSVNWVTGSNNKYKVSHDCLQEVVSVQQPGFASESGIYVVAKGTINSCTAAGAIQGGGMVIYLSNFIAKETEVTIDYAGGSCTFVVYYADGAELDPSAPVVTTLTATPASNLCKVGENIAITVVAKDQNGMTMADAGTVKYTISPADAGTIVDNVFTPTKAGLVTITASVGTIQAEPVEFYAYAGDNLALSTNIDTDNKIIAQSDINPTIGATNAFYAVDGNDSQWQGSYTNGTADNDVARTYDAWFVVDLGAYYDLDLVSIHFEGACSQAYTIAVSKDFVNWVTAYTYNGSAGVQQNRIDALYGTNLQNATDIRFVRFWSTKAATGYGMKIYDMQVYGSNRQEVTKTANKPVINSATVTSKNIEQAILSINTTSSVAIARYRVVDSANGIDWLVSSLNPAEYVIAHLKDNTPYTLSLYAYDIDGNISDVFTMEEFKTLADNTKPTTASPTPTQDEEDVLAFYSDTYTPVINWGSKKDWNSAGTVTENAISANNYLMYKDVTWWGWTYGVKDGYTDGTHTGINCSGMEYLHIDIWSDVAGSIWLKPIYGGTGLDNNENYYAVVEFEANKWNSVNIAIEDFHGSGDKHDFSSIYQLKFDQLSPNTATVSIDNVYFWKSAGTAPVESVTLDKTTATIEVDEALQLKATVLPIEASNKNVIWTSADETVATVVDGNITGLKEGTATITATSEENSEIKATCEITVEPITAKTWWGEPTTIKIEGVDVAILYSYTRNIDKTITYSVIFDNAASALRNDINVNLGNYNIMHDDGTGNNTAIWTSTTTHSKGETITGFWYIAGNRIDFTYLVGSSNERPSAAVTSVTLDKISSSLLIGETLQLTAIVNPGTATNKAVSWSSDNTTVAEVNADGLVTAKAEGTATITVTTVDGGKTATCTINVSPLQARTWWGTGRVTINGHDVDIIYSITHNLDKTLTYTVIFGDDTDMVREVNESSIDPGVYHPLTGFESVNKTASWTSTATHTSGEVITGFFWLGGNGVDFTYVVGSVNERPSLTVESVALNHTSYNLLVNETVQLGATITPGTAANKSVTWSSNNNAVATVDENGLVTAKSSGSATITVTTVDGGKIATCTINVIASLTETIYYANASFKAGNNYVGVNYSITRTTERKLRYEAVVHGEVVGLVMQFSNDNGANYNPMPYDAATQSYVCTLEQTFDDGTIIDGFFYPAFDGGANRWDYNYTVGSTNSPVRTMVGINDQEADQTTRLAQYTSPVDVVLARAITPDDDWFTISLPFALNATQITEIFGDGTQVLKLAKAGVAPDQVTELGFSPVNAIQAATPYLIKPTKKVNAGTVLRNITLATTSNPVKVSNVTMHPLLNQIEYDYTNDNVLFFLGTDNLLYYQATDNKLLGLRAYFTFDGVTTYSQAAQVRARVVFNENETTGVDNLITTDAPIKVIENGQLIIIRDGVKYNIQGQKL